MNEMSEMSELSEMSEMSEMRERSERIERIERIEWSERIEWNEWIFAKWVNKRATLRDELENKNFEKKWVGWQHFLTTTGKLKPPLQKKILEISVKPSPWFITVIELSGVSGAQVRFEITQHKVWFQKKIARQLPLVKSPLYYSHFEIAEFSQYQY